MPIWDALSSAMRFSRRRRLRRAEAERLLAGGTDPAHPELSRLLAAAAAPPRPHELTGLDAALAAFAEAGRAEQPAPAPRRRRVLQPLAVAGAVSVLLVGGAAVAAETGHLPGTGDPPASSRSEQARETPSSPARTSPRKEPSGPVASPGRTTAPPAPAAKDLVKLCRDWRQASKSKGKGTGPLKPDELRELARAAGGEARIPDFCAPLLEPPGRQSAGPHPPASHPGPNPSDGPGQGKGDDKGGGPAG